MSHVHFCYYRADLGSNSHSLHLFIIPALEEKIWVVEAGPWEFYDVLTVIGYNAKIPNNKANNINKTKGSNNKSKGYIVI